MTAPRAKAPPRVRGFTLIEAMVATIITSLVVATVGYGVGIAGDALREQREQLRRTLLIDAKLSELDGDDFYDLKGGLDTLTIDAMTYHRSWRVEPADGDGDGLADPGFRLITVRVEDDSCQTVTCDVR